MGHDFNAGTVAVVAGCVVAWGLVSTRLEAWNVTAPIAFVVLGLALANGPLAVIHVKLHSGDVRSLAEITLAVVLFVDACRVNAKALLAEPALPARLLGIGLPLTVAAGTGIAAGLFAGKGLWLAAALGAIVAPTDAALGASIVQDKRIPTGVRRALNVESGLNDGIVTPFVNLFLAGAATSEGVHSLGIADAVVDLVGGAALGAGIGVVGALLLIIASRVGWSSSYFRPISLLALALFAYATSLGAGVNGFVSAFATGIAFGTLIASDEVLVFAEDAGTLLSLLVWFAFGAVMVVPGFEAAGWRDVVFAILALTIVRMAPVSLGLVGSGFDRATVAFIGWFGPRGLATVVFGLIAVDSLAPADSRLVLGAVTVTVAMSVLLHGLSASPLAERYGKRMQRLPTGTLEHKPGIKLGTRSLAGGTRMNP